MQCADENCVQNHIHFWGLPLMLQEFVGILKTAGTKGCGVWLCCSSEMWLRHCKEPVLICHCLGTPRRNFVCYFGPLVLTPTLTAWLRSEANATHCCLCKLTFVSWAERLLTIREFCVRYALRPKQQLSTKRIMQQSRAKWQHSDERGRRNKLIIRDFRLPPLSSWELRFLGLLCNE